MVSSIARLSRPVTLLIVGLFFTSCAVTVRDIQTGPGFTADALVAGGVGIAGIIPHEREIADADQLDLSELLGSELRAGAPALKAESGLTTLSALGDPRAQAVKELSGGGTLSDATLAALSGREGLSFRFIAFVRLDDDTIEQNSTTEFVQGGGSRTTYETRRHTTATLFVYDTETATLGWRGTADKDDQEQSNTSTATSEDTANELLGGLINEALTGESAYHVPPTPLSEMLEPIFEGFATALFGEGG